MSADNGHPDTPYPLPLTDEVKRWLRSPIQLNHYGGPTWGGTIGIQRTDPYTWGPKAYGRVGLGNYIRGRHDRNK